MSERDGKIIAALAAYDATAVGTPERTQAAVALEKAVAGIGERDYHRIVEKYNKRKEAA